VRTIACGNVGPGGPSPQPPEDAVENAPVINPFSSSKSPLGAALKYIAKYWDGLNLFLSDGRIEMDNNTVERTIRPIAINRKNALFAGHDAGAENWVILASLIETCKLNGVEQHAYLTKTLSAIVNGHKQSKIYDLLPWNYADV